MRLGEGKLVYIDILCKYVDSVSTCKLPIKSIIHMWSLLQEAKSTVSDQIILDIAKLTRMHDSFLKLMSRAWEIWIT